MFFGRSTGPPQYTIQDKILKQMMYKSITFFSNFCSKTIILLFSHIQSSEKFNWTDVSIILVSIRKHTCAQKSGHFSFHTVKGGNHLINFK